MPSKKHHVQLTAEQRDHLEGIIRTGTEAAQTQIHARILLKADRSADGPAWQDDAIVSALDVSRPTVERVRRAFATHGLDAALHRRKAVRTRRRRLDGSQEARLIAVTCSAPPEGRERWTLSLLAEKLVELEVVDSIARETVRTTLKKTNLSRG
jgi:transposase